MSGLMKIFRFNSAGEVPRRLIESANVVEIVSPVPANPNFFNRRIPKSTINWRDPVDDR